MAACLNHRSVEEFHALGRLLSESRNLVSNTLNAHRHHFYCIEEIVGAIFREPLTVGCCALSLAFDV